MSRNVNKKVNNSEIFPICVRISELIAYAEKSATSFAKTLGISKSRVSNITTGRNKPDSDLLYEILTKYRNVNPLWLITGEGNMINPIDGAPKRVNVDTEDSSHSKRDTPIPLVNEEAVGGFGNNSFSISKEDVKEYYIIPKFRHSKVDFMIGVVGDSMSPRFKSGDIVACKIITGKQFIQWNNVHVIATAEQGIILKRIKPSLRKGYISIVADNPDFPPYDLPEEQILGLALVAGGIILES